MTPRSASWRRARCGCERPLAARPTPRLSPPGRPQGDGPRQAGPAGSPVRRRPRRPGRGWRLGTLHGRAAGLLVAWLMAAAGTPASAGALAPCAPAPPIDARQQHRQLQVAGLLGALLDASGARLAIVARAGIDLAPIGQRYSHAGLSLRDSPNTRWSVRQLYYDCDEGAPQIFDQGLAGFVMGGASPDLGHLSVLLLPPEAEAPLAAAALQAGTALGLLGARYSANAHAFSTRYQNCNQWLAELLAAAWGGTGATRAQAQAWLQQQGYQPAELQLRNPMHSLALWALPWLHWDDHPAADRQAQRLRVSLPESVAAFAQARWPGARMLWLCHAGGRVLLRDGGTPLDDACTGASGDRQWQLDAGGPLLPAGAATVVR